jgi:hypothetical protein
MPSHLHYILQKVLNDEKSREESQDNNSHKPSSKIIKVQLSFTEEITALRLASTTLNGGGAAVKLLLVDNRS